MLKVFERYAEFVESSADKHPHGDRNRGWTRFGLWLLLCIVVIIAIGTFVVFNWTGRAILIALLLAAEIILRVVDSNSN